MSPTQIEGATLNHHWHLEKLLGQGGMSYVYRAREHGTQRRVALKLLRDDPHVTAKWAERLQREAKLLMTLDHPSLVKVFAFERDPALGHYLVMELVQGPSLQDVLEQRGAPLTLEEMSYLFPRICAGMAYVHRAGLLHRDLKPENILLEGGQVAWNKVKVIDFGIARKQKDDSRLTEMGKTMGTPAYISPEQAIGQEEIDHRVDIYSLGVIVFEALTGRAPFEATSTYEYLVQHVTHEAPLASSFRAELKAIPKLDALLQDLLAKDPEKRPPHMTAVRERLIEALRDYGRHIGKASSDWLPAAVEASSGTYPATVTASIPTDLLMEAPIYKKNVTPGRSWSYAPPTPIPLTKPIEPTPPTEKAGSKATLGNVSTTQPQTQKGNEMNTAILKRAMKDIPGILGAGLVDMDTGLLIDVNTVDSHPNEVLDLVAATTKELFEGKSVQTIEQIFRERRGESEAEPYFRELIIYSTNLVHYFCRLPSNPRMVAVFVSPESVNIGMLLVQSRRILREETF